jgi:D-alanyl-D-alanine carboxypeptidase/D-alanyl-D-alanine-endopeptidase (penicillin-binding protein 4)
MPFFIFTVMRFLQIVVRFQLLYSLFLLGWTLTLNAQGTKRKHILNEAWEQLVLQPALKGSHLSFHLIDAKTGKAIFSKNENERLPPASTIKTFTTASALHVLGENYRYTTQFSFQGKVKSGKAKGILRIQADGDPSLGAERFAATQPKQLFKQIEQAFTKLGATELELTLDLSGKVYDDSSASKYWLEEDFGNYYGAGLFDFNWRENSFDLVLSSSGKDIRVESNTGGFSDINDFKLELKPNRDQDAFAFFDTGNTYAYVIRGGFTPDEKGKQTLQLATRNPKHYFMYDMQQYFGKRLTWDILPTTIHGTNRLLFVHRSPPISDMVIACNQKSINLYAEAFCKTIARKLNALGSWVKGIQRMKEGAVSWKIDTSTIQLFDASGLAPANKISTRTLAYLLYAYQRQKWFQTFRNSLPNIHGITMKSGYIGGTRSYAGYITLRDGRQACFAIIAHGYSGKPREVREALFAFLDGVKK